ncbi:amidohydrolase family protein [Pseudonocardia sp. CA-142604]|uniref:amidohydrolase family protein n=1 Tax=Pseudonocardia sp. CA-142604 TaxID=3240024 RepID=UPI003D92974C
MIDANLHAVVPGISALLPHLPAFWREQIATTAFRGPTESAWPPGMPMSEHPSALRPEGGPAGSDLELLRMQTLDAWDLEQGILNCGYAIESIRNPDAAAALAAAVNDWQIARWLEPEPRLRASVVVPSQSPALAVAEIERIGHHPGFVQVFLPIRSAMPYGRREYHPVYAAAVDHGLAVSLQYGGFTGNAPTPVGWPTYLIEEYVGMASIAQSQVMSMIIEGVCDAFPDLRVAVVDAGYTWLPATMWRFDKNWRGLRREVPWLRHPPSEYVREHFRFVSGPHDAPRDGAALAHVLSDMWGAQLLLFGSGYPQDHHAQPRDAVPSHFSPAEANQMMFDNARDFYRLDATMPTGGRS